MRFWASAIGIGIVGVLACGRVLDDDAPAASPSGDASVTDASPDDDAGDATDATSGTAPSAMPCSVAPSCTFAGDGCATTRLYDPIDEGRSEYPHGIATSSGYVFWASVMAALDGDDPAAGKGRARVFRVSKTGGADQQPFAIATDQRNVTALTATRTHVFWASEVTLASGPRFSVRSAPVACASPCDATEVYLMASDEIPTRLIALDETTLWLAKLDGSTRLLRLESEEPSPPGWVPEGPGARPMVARTALGDFIASPASVDVMKLDRAAPSTRSFVSVPEGGPPDPGPAALGGTCDSLWAVSASGSLFGVGVGSGQPTAPRTLVIPRDTWFDAVGDARFVYLAALGGLKALDTTSPAGVVSDIYKGSVRYVAVDDDGVYFGAQGETSLNAGAIYMVAKK
ncbi:MAG: hypothetical protein KF764_09800 [Labilithrix sp.]|nr:hypothetical protein [Labilithrix sp.]